MEHQGRCPSQSTVRDVTVALTHRSSDRIYGIDRDQESERGCDERLAVGKQLGDPIAEAGGGSRPFERRHGGGIGGTGWRSDRAARGPPVTVGGLGGGDHAGEPARPRRRRTQGGRDPVSDGVRSAPDRGDLMWLTFHSPSRKRAGGSASRHRHQSRDRRRVIAVVGRVPDRESRKGLSVRQAWRTDDIKTRMIHDRAW